jgi:hypothetical protein
MIQILPRKITFKSQMTKEKKIPAFMEPKIRKTTVGNFLEPTESIHSLASIYIRLILIVFFQLLLYFPGGLFAVKYQTKPEARPGIS